MKIIAEIGINHNGDLGVAKRLIDLAKRAGCDAVKFQKRTLDLVYTQRFLNSPRASPWGTTQRAQKEALEFGRKEYDEIDAYCRRLGIDWFASAWDVPSFEFLEAYNPPLNKIASPMLTHYKLLRVVAATQRQTLISTGMSDYDAILTAAEIFRRTDCPFALLHCVSEYPCPEDRINVAAMLSLRRNFPLAEIGYSHHSPGILPCIGAAFLGADWLEVHVTLDRSMYGSDQAASIEEPGLRRIVEYCRLAPQIMGDGIKRVTDAERSNARKLRYWLREWGET